MQGIEGAREYIVVNSGLELWRRTRMGEGGMMLASWKGPTSKRLVQDEATLRAQRQQGWETAAVTVNGGESVGNSGQDVSF